MRTIIALLVVGLPSSLSAQSGSTQGGVAGTHPDPSPVVTSRGVAAPGSRPPAAIVLPAGAYQLRLYFAPLGDLASAVTRTFDVRVATSGSVVTITSANPKDTLRGTMGGGAITAQGSGDGMSLTFAATATAAGASGSFVATYQSNTVNGTMALTRAYTTQAHGIETNGTRRTEAAAPQSWWQGLRTLFGR